MEARVERQMDLFLGKSRARGDIIPDEELAQVSQPMLHSLVENGYLCIAGMSPGRDSGMEQHLQARVDNLEDRVKRIEAAQENADMGDVAKPATAAPSAFKHPRRGRKE